MIFYIPRLDSSICDQFKNVCCNVSYEIQLIESYGSNSHIGFVPYHEIIKKTRPAYNSQTEKRIV